MDTLDVQRRPVRCVLVLGANGFLGGFIIVSALRSAGLRVVLQAPGSPA